MSQPTAMHEEGGRWGSDPPHGSLRSAGVHARALLRSPTPGVLLLLLLPPAVSQSVLGRPPGLPVSMEKQVRPGVPRRGGGRAERAGAAKHVCVAERFPPLSCKPFSPSKNCPGRPTPGEQSSRCGCTPLAVASPVRCGFDARRKCHFLIAVEPPLSLLRPADPPVLTPPPLCREARGRDSTWRAASGSLSDSEQRAAFSGPLCHLSPSLSGPRR
ncbi:hypothetical protein SKAU_G00073140 [Synaphobranchus kaupii]|uniref:Uncharacterized protein n=1 Tax=Synaphobranchus kaupii TaxID=118154 RepID=A0A9Q1G8A9_SYNKA|nr:hypothetical protein SKAU_G00073140 [Synaphobranchus kaupii]